MTKYLFFDTETNGLPLDWLASPNKVNMWPHVVSIAWIVSTEQGNIISKNVHTIKPNGWTIPHEAEKIHGISTEYALLNGQPIKTILPLLENDVKKASLIVAHNYQFDMNIISAEFVRAHIKTELGLKSHYCTMIKSKKLCSIIGLYGKLKYPSLQELHYKLFSEYFNEAHNAMIDVKTCLKCFLELKRIGVI